MGGRDELLTRPKEGRAHPCSKKNPWKNLDDAWSSRADQTFGLKTATNTSQYKQYNQIFGFSRSTLMTLTPNMSQLAKRRADLI